MAYTDPKVFVTGEPLLAADLNEISDNVRYLFSPNRAIVTNRNITNVTVTGTSWAAVSGFRLSLDVTSGRWLEIGLHIASAAFDTITRQCQFDIFIDDTNYLSSLTTTPLTNGLYAVSSSAAATEATPVSFHVLWQAPAAGYHTLELRARLNGTGNCALALANTLSQFYAREV